MFGPSIWNPCFRSSDSKKCLANRTKSCRMADLFKKTKPFYIN